MNTNSSTSRHTLKTYTQALQNGLDPKRADNLLDEMMRLAGELGTVTCTVVENQILRVQSNDTILDETHMRLAKSKFRSLCARLAIRCQEWSGQELSLYGDTVEFEHPSTRNRYKVKYRNVPGLPKFEIENCTASSRKLEAHRN